MSVKHFTIKNKKFYYTDMSEYRIQIGKGSKSSYKTKKIIKGNLQEAIAAFDLLNISKGYKKRMMIDGKVVFKLNK